MQKWYFKQVSLTSAITGIVFAILFFISALHGYLGGHALYPALLLLIGTLTLLSSLHSLSYWKSLRHREEVIVLDTSWLYYKVFPSGEGSIKYEWLQNIRLSHGISSYRLVLEYKIPEQNGATPRRATIELSRLRHPGPTSQIPFFYIKAAKMLKKEIISRRTANQALAGSPVSQTDCQPAGRPDKH